MPPPSRIVLYLNGKTAGKLKSNWNILSSCCQSCNWRRKWLTGHFYLASGKWKLIPTSRVGRSPLPVSEMRQCHIGLQQLLWAISQYSGPFCTILGHFVPFCTILGHLDYFGLFGPSLGNLDCLEQFWAKWSRIAKKAQKSHMMCKITHSV